MKITISLLLQVFGLALYAQDFTRIDPNAPIRSFAVADFDGDGDADIFGIASSINQYTDVFYYLNNGGSPISFEEILLDEFVEVVPTPTAADYDGDGDMDILVTKGSSYDVYAFKNNGNAGFQETSLGVSAYGILSFHDFDGDGDLDFSSSDYLSSLAVYINNGTQSYTKHDVITNSLLVIRSVAIGDLNSDGKPELVVGYRTPPGAGPDLEFYMIDNNNNFTLHELSSDAFSRLTTVAIADVDKDGKLDIAAGSYQNYLVWKNNGNLEFEEQALVPYTGTSPFGIRCLDMVDINGDNIPDPVMGDDIGPIVWYKNIGTSPLQYEKREVGNTAPCGIVKHADFDLDGDNDLVVSNGGMYIYENNAEQVSAIIENSPSLRFEVSPNPSSGVVQVHSLPPGQYRYELHDLNGVLLRKGSLLSGQVNLALLAAGSYILSIVEERTGKRYAGEVIKH